MTIPNSKKEITVEYLNTVLKETILKNGNNKIISIKDGDSIPPQFKSIVFRIIPTYENENDNLPKSFIIKLATDNPGINKLLTSVQGYYKEVHFYKELEKIPELKTPAIYYSEVNDKKDKFIVIMEDLNLRNLFVGSQAEPIDFNFAVSIVKYFALLQSKFWNYEGNALFKKTEWLKETNFALYLKDLTIQMFEERKQSFIERNKSKLNEKTISTIQTVDIKKLYEEHFPKDLKHCSLVHGDAQPSNVFIDKTTNEIVMIDWQYSSIGYSLKDIILLIGIWIDKKTSKEEILKIKDIYYEELIKNGVKDFSKEDFEVQWKNCLLLSLCNIASVSEKENIGDDEEKKRKYRDYLDLSESRFINFIQSQEF